MKKITKRIFSDAERQAPTDIKYAEPSHLARYQFALNYVFENNKILDVPCGSGYGTKLLSLKGAEVKGVDISKKAIGHAKEFFSDDKNSFIVGDMEKLNEVLPENGNFDVIVSFEGIEHIKNAEIFLDEIKRLLKKDGRFIISTPRKPHGSPYHFKEYLLDEFKTLLETRFDVKKMFGQIYTDIFDLNERNVNPDDYKKFTFIAYCITKQNK